MDITRLPPKPDTRTGVPRPPSAPLERGNSKPGHRRARAESKVPQPPSGEGPLLEWFYPDRTTRLISGFFVVLLGIVYLTFRDGGFGWMGTIWLWLLLVPWPILFLVTGRNVRMSAGADWLAYGKSFVKTYELVAVDVVIDGAAHSLKIKDSLGNGIHAQVNDLQQNHELWDLVYNGLLHSVHVGKAETGKRAREYLQLDYPPHLAERA
ncbi:hypothetical protein [Amycolatopsis nigrescens]|uniref:hypothetical protein n=1 Tax=Amycolatopsis nigrescens TaxID=381445 RepID=UPI0004763351|nr:hypothetical protein [Amycolatopsis nigrescens]